MNAVQDVKPRLVGLFGDSVRIVEAGSELFVQRRASTPARTWQPHLAFDMVSDNFAFTRARSAATQLAKQLTTEAVAAA